MPGEILDQDSYWEHDHRWKPVNSLKNSNLTVQIYSPLSGKRFNIPEKPPSAVDDDGDNEVEPLSGTATLRDLIRRVKKHMPGLYLWDQVGGATLSCGPRQVYQTEWDDTMLWELVREEAAGGEEENKGKVPRVVLEDGREAYLITIGEWEREEGGRRSRRWAIGVWRRGTCTAEASAARIGPRAEREKRTKKREEGGLRDEHAVGPRSDAFCANITTKRT